MRLGKLLLIGLTVCIYFTYLQRNNLKSIWTEYWKLHKNFDPKMFNGYNPRIPAINKKNEKTDPQAAAIINYKLSYFERDDANKFEILAKNCLKYPANQYFLYELATNSYRAIEEGLSPLILSKLAERLIQLDSENENYYNLKAYALLKSRKGNDFSKVIETLKKAGQCPGRKNPYLLYKQRVISLAKKQDLHFRLIEELNYEAYYDFYLYDTRRELIKYQNFLITENRLDEEKEISLLIKQTTTEDRLQRMQWSMPGGFGGWQLPQQLELQRLNLTKAEADERRMELASYFSFDTIAKSQHESYDERKDANKYVLAIFPFLLLSRLSFIYFTIGLILFILIILRREKLAGFKISKGALGRYMIYSIIFVFSGMLIFTAEIMGELAMGHTHYTYSEIFLFPAFLKEVLSGLSWRDLKEIADAPFYVFLPFISFAAFNLMGIVKFFKPHFDNIVTRIIGAILLAIPAGLLAGVIQGHKYFKYFLAVFFILYAFKYSFRKLKMRNILRALAGSGKEGIADIRAELLYLSGISFLICWFIVLLLTPPTFKSINSEIKKYNGKQIYSYSGNAKKGYKEILKKLYDVNSSEHTFIYFLPLVQSDDLTAVLQDLKKRKYTELQPIGFLRINDVNDKTSGENFDRIMTGYLMFAGKDQLASIVGSINNPDKPRTLTARALLGDKQIKDALLKVLAERRNIGDEPAFESKRSEEIPREYQLITALTVILEPNETVDLVNEYFESHKAERLDMYFHKRAITLLPTPYARKVLNLYLEKVEKEIDSMEDLRKMQLLYPLRETGGFYWDNKTAKNVLSLILKAYYGDEHIEVFGIEYFIDADSAEILLKGLQSDKENLRALCLSLLEKIGYKLNQQQIAKIENDKSWKVRANLSVIDKKNVKEDETDYFVRLIKSL
ncbi:MAG: hypothetical protein ABFD79_10135 [Phycisphaerales bacterium]